MVKPGEPQNQDVGCGLGSLMRDGLGGVPLAASAQSDPVGLDPRSRSRAPAVPIAVLGSVSSFSQVPVSKKVSSSSQCTTRTVASVNPASSPAIFTGLSGVSLSMASTMRLIISWPRFRSPAPPHTTGNIPTDAEAKGPFSVGQAGVVMRHHLRMAVAWQRDHDERGQRPKRDRSGMHQLQPGRRHR